MKRPLVWMVGIAAVVVAACGVSGAEQDACEQTESFIDGKLNFPAEAEYTVPCDQRAIYLDEPGYTAVSGQVSAPNAFGTQSISSVLNTR